MRDYRERQSEAAFAELVGRYVGLVYSTALRLVGEPEIAKDVSQTVFIDFARKAGSIRVSAALPGWLYRVTCCQAKNAIRTEQRRRHREAEALSMADTNPPASNTWKDIAPLLDEAIGELDKSDQEAVIWRFFQGRSFREIGLALTVSEDAAQKRVSRAVERLRELFAKRGVSVGAEGLVVVMAANAVQAAPAGLAAGISAAALAATAGQTGAAAGLIKLLTMTKLQTAIIGAMVVAAAVVTPLVMRHEANLRRENESLREQLTQIKMANEGLSNRVAAALGSRGPRGAAPGATNPPALTSFQQVEEFIGSHGSGLSRAQIEAYLQQNHRNVESLLAAYQVSRDASYLREAATNAPNNPAVQFAVLANNVYPDEQRQWIDAFKTSSPGNALPWYFSALDYFKSNQSAQAIEELTQATQRQLYGDYAAQTGQAVEEMYDSAGWPALAAKACAPGTAASSALTYLGVLKALANDTVQAQQQYVSQGDTGSATSMASMGMQLGNQLRNAPGPIDELMGVAIEKKILAQLDPAQSYDFLDGPVSEVEAKLEQQKQLIQQALQTRDQVRPTLNETELNDYWEREKIYGEMYALQWLQSKYHQP
jgi:RNA polymerase sigma factor (sigma-70 family)